MAFKDLRDFHDPDLVLPIGGKEYRIKQPNAKRGLEIRQLFASEMIGDSTELEQIMSILGAEWVPNLREVGILNAMTGEPVLDEDGKPVTEERDFGTWEGGVWSEMSDDGVSWEEIMHAGRTALLDVGMGRIVAETHWVSGMPVSMDLPEVDALPDGADLPDADSGNSGPVAPNREARRAAEKKKPKKK